MGRLLQFILSPLSLCYGLIMQSRNLLFDIGILSQKSFEKSIISVGNLSYGGTGKTPHIEYLIHLLQPNYSVGTLSRGYGRDSKGFILASKRSNIKYIGDEPLQYLKKFENLQVAVDEQRCRGINLMLQKHPELEVILLDDAFQHRYVKPGLSILLTDYHHLYTEDYVLPSGTLREFRSAAKRADIIVVTKTPKIFSPITRRRILEDLRPASHQRIYFSYLKYSAPIPFQDSDQFAFPLKPINILLFTGIANDYPLREHLERICSELITINYPDHHQYTEKDLDIIKKKFDDLPTKKKILVTTEKDVMRLKTPELSTKLKNLPLFYVPIEVDFHQNDKQQFDNEIINYVKKN
ncbi:MAG: tetraacyldisaccharide 4'-kinase [Bacteroidales bacterium]|nr:tetraacyldisaccharide 4'-kinase [Bacteroidales bacterium]